SHHDRRPTCESGRRLFRSCRVRPRQTSTADPQSLAPACSQSPPIGSHRCRLVRSIYAAVPADPFGPCSEAVDSPAPSPNHDQPKPDAGGPSWLTFLGHSKDSLWSTDLIRCESAALRTHWILVVMDQYTRRIIGFGLHAGAVDSIALCRMFNHAIRGHRSIP